jgi:hypothetical protein
MTRQGWDRIGGMCGIAYAVLIAAGWIFWAAPGIVEYDSSAPVVAQWFADHQLMSRIGATLGTLALFPFVFFLGALQGRLRRAEGDNPVASSAALVAGAINGAMHFVFLMFLFAACFRPADTSPDVTQALNDLYLIAAPPCAAVMSAEVAAISFVVLRHGALPRWVGRSGIAAAVAVLLLIPTPFTDHGIFDPSDGLLGVYVPYGGFLLWITLVGASMAAQGRRGRAPVAAPAPADPALAGAR